MVTVCNIHCCCFSHTQKISPLSVLYLFSNVFEEHIGPYNRRALSVTSDEQSRFQNAYTSKDWFLYLIKGCKEAQSHHKHTSSECFLISASKILDGHLLLFLHTNQGQRILLVASGNLDNIRQ